MKVRRSTPALAIVVMGVLATSASAAVVHRPNGRFFGITLRRGVSLAQVAGSIASRHAQVFAGSSGLLSYHGGPVLHSSAPYLIFWLPAGHSLPAGAQSLMERYLADVAADSGKATNVFSVGRQYYDGTGIADYAQTFSAAQVVVDTTPFPATDSTNCPDVNATYYPRCLTDGQLQTEIANVIAARGLPVGNASPTPIYFLVTPADVNVCADSANCADTTFCAYHSTFSDQGSPVLYASTPFFLSSNKADTKQYAKACQQDVNTAIQEPNGNLADVAISYMSHEDSETITDPFGSGWWDSATGNEDGDNCLTAFEPTIAGDPTAGTLYDQVINGNTYYTQAEWSNGGASCQMRPGAGTMAPQISAPNAGFTAVGAAQMLDPSATASTNPISSARWLFGDGSASTFQSGFAALGTVTHAYASAGRYTVTLSLVDDRGNVASSTQTITIGSPPSPSLGLSPGNPIAGTPVSFDATGTSDLDPGVTVTSYAWGLGDGTTAAGPVLSHTYTAPGTYTVSLTVTNSLGLSQMVVRQLTVAPEQIVGVTVKKHRRGVLILVSINGPGGLSIGHLSKMARTAGKKKLIVWLTRSQLRTLAKKHRLTLRVRIRFAPTFGPASGQTVTIRFRR